MGLNRFTIKAKLALAIASVIALIAVLGAWAINGLQVTQSAAHSMCALTGYQEELLHREIDHLSWVQKAGLFLSDETVNTLDVQKDPHKCKFGEWYYGEGRKEVELVIPALAERFQAIESSHNRLHQSAAKIESFLQGGNRLAAVRTYNLETRKPLAEVREQLDSILETIESRVHQERDSLNQRIALTKSSLMVGVIVIGVIAMFAGFLISRQITDPLRRTVSILKDIAQGEGNLTVRLEANRHDEFGEMAYWFNTFVDKLRLIIRDVKDSANTVQAAATELSTVSEQVSGSATDLSERSRSVAAATEEMSMSMGVMAYAATDSSSNIHSVSLSTQEMTASAQEIASGAEISRQSALDAVKSVEGASQKVNELGFAAKEIDQVIETIIEIAEQTKLLALNATIEAARAGTAGKGFAVVADEVKELAKQTNAASAEIRQKIEAIQHSTLGTISEITQISKVINHVNEAISTIAAAAEQQSATANQIAGNIGQAETGIQEVAQNANQATNVSKEVASDIVSVNATTDELRAASHQMTNNALELAQMGSRLRDLVDRFKTD